MKALPQSAVGGLPRNPRPPLLCALVLFFILHPSSLLPLLAAPLDPRAWTVRDNTDQPATEAFDGRIDTAWTSTDAQVAPLALEIDLGQRCWVHGIHLTPGDARSHYPRALRVTAGDSLDTMRPIVARKLPYDVQTLLRFEPAIARHWRLEIVGRGAGYPWTVAEIIMHGGTNPPPAPVNWIVVDRTAPDLLQFAAEELRYYIGELTGKPTTRTFAPPPSDPAGFVFRITAPPPLPDYETYIQDPRFQHPERARVRRDNAEITLGGATPLAVLGAVYTLLDAEGVRWLYPDPLGEFVPARGNLLLASPTNRLTEHATFTTTPPFARRYANWNSERYESDRDDYLWYFRNRWNASWNGRINDRPGVPTAAQTPPFGYTHTFSELVPAELFATHPDWFPMFRHPRWIPRIGIANLGRRIPYDTTWGLNFCTSNRGVIDHIVKRILDTSAPASFAEIVWLVPMDAGSFCECDTCCDADAPDQQDSDQWKGGLAMSNRYFTFIGAVAKRLRSARPNLKIGAFAYEGYLQPPSKFPRLPDNVVVDVVQYGAYQLPLTAPPNAWMADVMHGWARRWKEPGHVGVYDWALLLANARGIPVPMVTSLAQRIRMFHDLGVQRIGTQADADPDVWKYNPWNFYAYSRLLQHPTESPATILQEFFDGYYGDAGAPMRAYYETIESHWLATNVDFGKSLDYKPTAAAYPDTLIRKMSAHLSEARAQASTWITQQRVADATTGFNQVLKQLR